MRRILSAYSEEVLCQAFGSISRFFRNKPSRLCGLPQVLGRASLLETEDKSCPAPQSVMELQSGLINSRRLGEIV